MTFYPARTGGTRLGPAWARWQGPVWPGAEAAQGHSTTFPSSQVRKTQVGEDFRK